MGYHDTTIDAFVQADRAVAFDLVGATGMRRPRAPGSQPGSLGGDHGRAALASALDDGLMPDEVAEILAGRRIVDAFPVRWGESPSAYAARAVAEMMVVYLR